MKYHIGQQVKIIKQVGLNKNSIATIIDIDHIEQEVYLKSGPIQIAAWIKTSDITPYREDKLNLL